MVPPHPIWDPRDAGPRERKKTAMWSRFYTVLLRAPSGQSVGGEEDKKAEQWESRAFCIWGSSWLFCFLGSDNSSQQQPCGEVPLLSPF